MIVQLPVNHISIPHYRQKLPTLFYCGYHKYLIIEFYKINLVVDLKVSEFCSCLYYQ